MWYLRLIVRAWLVLLPYQAASATSLAVRIDIHEDSLPAAPARQATGQSFVVAEPVDGGEAVRVETAIPGAAILTLSSDHRWRIGIEGDDWWAPRESVDPRKALGTIRIEAFRAGRVAGRLVANDPLPEGASLQVRLLHRRTRTTRRATEGVSPCAPREDGVFRCSVPAGILDLRLEPSTGAPALRWNVEVTAGQLFELGAVRIREPSELRGLVLDMGSGQPVEGATVRVRPASLGDLYLLETQRFALAGASAETRAGRFALPPMAPGIYDLEISGKGWSSAKISGIRLRAGEAVELPDPVLLPRPASLEVFFTPSVAPAGDPWRVRLLRQKGPQSVELVHLEIPEADPAGWWLVNGLEPGSYRLQVATQSSSRWIDRSLSLEPGLNTLQLDIGGIMVRGTVAAGDEPISGTVWFGGHSGQSSIHMKIDDEGRFQGHLPHAGEWRIDISRGATGAIQRLRPVVVAPPAPGEAAVVALELPATVLRGEVVTPAWNPVPDAMVEILDPFRGHLEGATRADEQGRFEFLGLESGTYFVEAESADARSDSLLLDLAENRPASEVTLIVRPERSVEGLVIGPSGPVAGSAVLVIPLSGTPAPVPVVSTTTGADGSFTVTVRESVTGFQLVVRAPGHPVTLASLSPTDGQVTITLPAAGGSIHLISDDTASLGRSSLAYEGVSLPVALIRDFIGVTTGSGDGGGGLVLPAMAPGMYSLCAPVMPGSTQRRGVEVARCPAGYLAPGGELVLTVNPGAHNDAEVEDEASP